MSRAGEPVTLAQLSGVISLPGGPLGGKPLAGDAGSPRPLERAGGNKSEAARIVGVARCTMHRRTKKREVSSSLRD